MTINHSSHGTYRESIIDLHYKQYVYIYDIHKYTYYIIKTNIYDDIIRIWFQIWLSSTHLSVLFRPRRVQRQGRGAWLWCSTEAEETTRGGQGVAPEGGRSISSFWSESVKRWSINDPFIDDFPIYRWYMVDIWMICGWYMDNIYTGWWWLEHGFYFPIYWECHPPNWLSYFSEGLKPPTRWRCLIDLYTHQWILWIIQWFINDILEYSYYLGKLQRPQPTTSPWMTVSKVNYPEMALFQVSEIS